MTEDKNEKVDWVMPVAQGVNISGTPPENFLKAVEQKGIIMENLRENNKNQLVADIYKKVVVGMPAPRENSTEEKK
jgi:hypothetical protein